jgi:ribonucleoside-diphosphate reductase alpha chain
MANYSNYQSDNAKYGIANRNNYNPALNPTVNPKGMEQATAFEKNLDKYIEFASWLRWYPDLFLDMIAPQKGALKLHSDQRIYLRCIVRFMSLYGVFPRGYGKTFNEVLAMFLIAISYPGIELAMTAQTKENAAELLKDKYMEIIKYYPMLKNEVIETKFSKNDAEIAFVNGSRVDILANSNSSKGQRRKRINIEEAALLDNETFMDALQPIVEVPRSTVGKLAVVDPEELNQQINFFTTSGFRGSDEFARSLRMIGGMVDLTGEMILGSDWHLACWYGRGSTKAQIKKKKETMSPISFAQNYMSRWVGASDNALVDINKLLKLRVLTSPKFKADKDGEYYLGVDVARSQATSNNQTSVSVLEVKRNKNNKITQIMLVNMFTISNSLNFTQQALRVKQIRKDFNAKVVCVDTNGLGVGLLDELLKESFDPYTGESYGCWDTLNTDVHPEIKGSEKVIYDLKPQSANSDIIVSFIDMVESGKLKLLEKVTENQINIPDEKAAELFAPYKQTDLLVEEIANLRLKHLPSGKLAIEKVIKRYDKDRFSSLIYALWYIKTFEENIYEQIDDWSSYVIAGAGASIWQ